MGDNIELESLAEMANESETAGLSLLTIGVSLSVIFLFFCVLKQIYPEKFKIPERLVRSDQTFEYQTISLDEDFDIKLSSDEFDHETSHDDGFQRDISHFDINDRNYL